MDVSGDLSSPEPLVERADKGDSPPAGEITAAKMPAAAEVPLLAES